MVLYHMNLCAQKMTRHRDVSSTLSPSMSQPVMVTSQTRCHHVDSSRGRGNCEEERDIAIWKLKVAVVARTTSFSPIPQSIQSPLAIAAAAAEAEKEPSRRLLSCPTNPFATSSGLASAIVACSGLAGGWSLHTWGTLIAKAICCLRLEMRFLAKKCRTEDAVEVR